MRSVVLAVVGSFAAVAAGAAPLSAADAAPTAASDPAVAPAPGVNSPAVERGDAFLGLSVPDIKARVRKADATKMSARDRQCRDYVKARMPKWWAPSGHTVVCRPGTTKGYDFYFDGIAVLTVNSTLDPQAWAQSVSWAASKVSATERLPLTDAPKLCRKAIAAYPRLAKKAGNYRIRCVPQITWKVPDISVKDASVLGYIQYSKRDIAILETRDVKSMSFVTAHELGHAVSYLPKGAGLRTEVTKGAKRRTFTSSPYVGMPAEVWAESFARYWTGQNPASVQKTRYTPAQVDRMLKKYGLPRR
ncbi:hypothetical protein [Mobilicoccus massiliensis]|uniref:hypothetical protein n=1 Tax=Mobilicoccus massiliensis TaxID=1522310 RepID=UPI001141E0B8|nr:hypothetical protein [Mobilicoccus massiliensis]